MYVSLQKPQTMDSAENVELGLKHNDFETIFDDNCLPNEFDKEKITDIFEILHGQERNDLVREFKNVLEYARLKVWKYSMFVSKTLLS